MRPANSWRRVWLLADSQVEAYRTEILRLLDDSLVESIIMSATQEVTIRSLAATFFDAIEAGDIDTMRNSFTPEAEIWHNTDEVVVSRDATAKVLTGMVQRIVNIKYSNRRLAVFPGGFVQQHVLEGSRVHDGEKVRLPCALVCLVQDAKITRLDEYFDSAHVETFRKFAPPPHL